MSGWPGWRRANDGNISRCRCHGAWVWLGVCPVGIEPVEYVIRVFAAEQQLGTGQPGSQRSA